MRTTTAILVATLGLAGGACKAGKNSAASTKAAEPPAETFVPALPSVATASSTMLPDGKPPELVLIVDGDGSMHLAAGPKSWAWFNTGELRARSRPVQARVAEMTIKEARALGQDGQEVLKHWDEPGDIDLALADGDHDEAYADDPPPPEPEDEDDDYGDDSGGTGTAMALDEGKMGKKDSDRAEGQYQMRRSGDAPGIDRGRPGWCGAIFGDGDRPERQCGAMGDIVTDGKLAHDAYAVMLAAPQAKAAPLVDLFEAIELIGVTVAGKVRVLRLDFGRKHRDQQISEDARWIEVRIGKNSLEVEAVPDKPQQLAWPDGPLDGAALAKAYDAAIASRSLDHDAAVDILVAPDTDMQHVVDVVAALDAAGAKYIGLGAAPAAGSNQAKLRGARIPHVVLRGAAPDSPVAELAGPISECYATLIASRPDAVGDLGVAFLLKKGTPTNVVVKGLDPALETCVAAAVGKVKFLASNNSLQVNATYTLSN